MFLLVTSVVFAQAKTGKFEVKGNCGMCEDRIEKAAKSVLMVLPPSNGINNNLYQMRPSKRNNNANKCLSIIL